MVRRAEKKLVELDIRLAPCPARRNSRGLGTRVLLHILGHRGGLSIAHRLAHRFALRIAHRLAHLLAHRLAHRLAHLLAHRLAHRLAQRLAHRTAHRPALSPKWCSNPPVVSIFVSRSSKVKVGESRNFKNADWASSPSVTFGPNGSEWISNVSNSKRA
jgi:hypothetical protein